MREQLGQRSTKVGRLAISNLASMFKQSRDLSHYTALRKSEKVVYETIRKEMVLLRSSLRTAYYLGHQVPDLFMLFPKLAARYVPRRQWLAKDDFAALLEKPTPARGIYLSVAFDTGARRRELARMTLQHKILRPGDQPQATAPQPTAQTETKEPSAVEWLSPADAAKLLNVGVKRVYQWLKDNSLGHYRFGPREVRISSAQLQAFVDAQLRATQH